MPDSFFDTLSQKLVSLTCPSNIMEAQTVVYIIIILGAVFLIGGFLGLIFLFNLKADKHQKKKAGKAPEIIPAEEIGAHSEATPAPPGPEPSRTINTNTRPSFGLKQIYLPVGVMGVSFLIALIFLPQLPEELAIRFDSGGEPVNWASLGTVMLAGLGLQVILVLGGWFNGHTINKVAYSGNMGVASNPKPRRVAILSANMVVLLQVIVAFIMVDIFSFNVSGVHLMPVWLFVVVAMLIGGIIIAYNFVKIARLK